MLSSSLVPYPYFQGKRVRARAQANGQEDSVDRNAAVDAAKAAMIPRFSRRLSLGFASSLGLAVGANFGGMTSLLLGLSPEAARSLRLDVLYPVGGFFRYLDLDKGYEFRYPQDWLGDQMVLYRTIEKSEKARSLDLPSLQGKNSATTPVVEPAVAFGPPGSSGELNVSVILAPALPGFMIDELGNAEEVGSLILRKFIAPEGSNKAATLIRARTREETTNEGQKVVLYTVEYTVKGPNFRRHNIAVYTTHRSQLYSLNVQVPEDQWPSNREKCAAIADSFKVFT